MAPLYTTRRDAIEREILPNLVGFAHTFDIDGIADETIIYDAQRGGFVLVDGADFWAAVQRHALVNVKYNEAGGETIE